jgi:hypothetical protein
MSTMRPNINAARLYEGRQSEPSVRSHDLGVRPVDPPDAETAVSSIKFPVALNSNWRVTNDRLQWRLEVRKGNQRWKASGYQCRAFCVSRTGLLLCIREYCGEVYPPSVKLLEQLPDFYPHRREG